MRSKELTDADVLREFAAFLWTFQGVAAAKIDEDEVLCCGGGGGARAAREQLEEGDDRRGRMERPEGRAIYKASLISGREKRGGHGVVISPERRLDFRDGSKDKIRCDSGGVKNGLNGR